MPAPRARSRSSGRAPARPARPPLFRLHAAEEPFAGRERSIERLTWVVAALFGLGLLVMVLGPHRVGDYMTETDFYGQYAEGARLIQHGHLDPSRYGVVGPAYEIALALAGLVVRNLFLAAGLLSALASVATVLLWSLLLRRRGAPAREAPGSAAAALVTAIFLVTNAQFFRYGYSVTTDALAIALQAGAFALLFAREGIGAAIGAGTLAALAFLTRYNAIALLPAGLVAILARGTRDSGASRAGAQRRGRAALGFGAAFAAVVVPWVGYCLARGTGFSFQLHHNIAYEVFARSRGIPWDTYQRTMQPQFRSLADVIARDPAAVLSRMTFNVFDHLRQDAASLLGWPLAIAAALGAILALGPTAPGAVGTPRTARRVWPLVATWALLFLSLVPAFSSARYSLALLPFYAAAAAHFFVSPRFACALGRTGRLRLKSALVVVPVVAALAASWRVQVRVLDQLPVEVLGAARTLRALARPGDRVIARKPHVAFHAGLDPAPFPFVRTLPELAAFARSQHARWLYFSWPEAETRQAFWYLLDTSAAVPGLTARAVTRPNPAVLYEIGPDFGREPAWLANDTLFTLHVARARVLVTRASAPMLIRYAETALAEGRPVDARAAYERAAELDPRNLDPLIALGKLCLRIGDTEAGAAAFRRAALLEPDDPNARTGLGWASYLAGRSREAADLWRPLVARTVDSATLAAMAEVYHAVGDREAEAEARAALARSRAAR
ncbi:MAG TPA: tetratricopeptide repeat protein [Terriglobales bacterium]|nr:tetratricopeptide repeat protein [Terriglobales bacterium]